MSDSTTCKRTALHDTHVAAGARMVDFAGWRLPVQYAGLIEEHRAVRTRAGLFDVSHMGEVRVRGPAAESLLQRLTCNDVSRLGAGRAHYTGMITPRGGFVDDLLVYRLGAEEFLLVTNAANTAKDLAWIERNAAGLEVEIGDESERWAQIALQGPRAVRILAPCAGSPVEDLRYYGFRRTVVHGVDCIVSRTGYTGEDGFEIYAPAAEAEGIWSALMRSGEPHGLAPAGLGARDTLRLEAKMALYGQDIDETTTPFEADLGWIVKVDKGEFTGRDTLLRQSREGVARRLAGFEMRGRAIARHGYPVFDGAREVGRVTSGSYAPSLDRRIGLAYLPVELGARGTPIEIQIRNRREPATVVPTPFYRRSRS